MRRTIAVVLRLVFVLAIGTFLGPDLEPVQAQPNGCRAFQAIAQATLPTSTPLIPADVWGGPLYGMLGDELFVGVFSGNDGDEKWRGAIGQGKGGSYTVCVGYPTCSDSFTYEVRNAVFPSPPGKGGIGRYNGNTARIVQGTGRLQYASGSLNVTGPYIAWPDVASPFGFSGRWNVEIAGNICGIQ
jgi:hypothetical protein